MQSSDLTDMGNQCRTDNMFVGENHNMMELEDGTTIETIYLECIREFQEKYFSMKPNEWRHLVRDYVREVTKRPDLDDNELFTYKSAI